MTPGFKTSELWFKLIAIVMSTLSASGVFTNDTTIKIVGMIAPIVAAIAYTFARTSVKNTEALAAMPEGSSDPGKWEAFMKLIDAYLNRQATGPTSAPGTFPSTPKPAAAPAMPVTPKDNTTV